MKLDALRRRVERAEGLVDGRIAQTVAQQRRFREDWRLAWSPGRIVIVGLVAGFFAGKVRTARIVGAVSATRWVQLATSVTGLFASLQAAWAAQSAETAAEGAESAAEGAESAAGVAATAAESGGAGSGAAAAAGAPPAEPPTRPSVSDGRRRPDTQWDSEPRPAEAATELSER